MFCGPLTKKKAGSRSRPSVADLFFVLRLVRDADVPVAAAESDAGGAATDGQLDLVVFLDAVFNAGTQVDREEPGHFRYSQASRRK